jgi:hypothetical protein
VDEVEARWQLLRRSRPKLSGLEVWWSKYSHRGGMPSFIHAGKTIARVLGLELSDKLSNNKRHQKPFAKKEHEKFMKWAREQDRAYLKLANYSKPQRRLIKRIQWGRHPKQRLFIDGRLESKLL